MIPILICFEENNFWPDFWVRVPLWEKNAKIFFFKTYQYGYHLKDLIKLSWNMCFFKLFWPNFYQYRPKTCVFWHKITVMPKNPTGSVKIIPKTKFFSPIYTLLKWRIQIFLQKWVIYLSFFKYVLLVLILLKYRKYLHKKSYFKKN